MRRYGAYHYSGDRDLGEVEIGQTHATVTVARSSKPVLARILERTTDPTSGAVVQLILDRLVVPHYTSRVGPWNVSGAYVTQLNREAPTPPTV